MDENRPKWTVNTELIARQKKAIPLLLTLPVERACDEAGLSKQTVYTWLKQDAFKKKIRRYRDELMQNAIEDEDNETYIYLCSCWTDSNMERDPRAIPQRRS